MGIDKTHYLNACARRDMSMDKPSRASEFVWLICAIRFAYLYTIGRSIPEASGMLSLDSNVYCGFWLVCHFPSPLKVNRMTHIDNQTGVATISD